MQRMRLKELIEHTVGLRGGTLRVADDWFICFGGRGKGKELLDSLKKEESWGEHDLEKRDEKSKTN